MDRRSQRTRRAIYEAFSGLLARKKYSQITVQEILDAADIGRSTFYAHFSTKEDLLREICDELFGHIFYYAPPLREDAGGEAENLRRMLEHILLHMERDGRTIRGILSSESSGYFLQCFKEYMDQFTDRYILRGREGELGRVDPAFFKNHISSSFIEAVRWWFSQGQRTAPRDLAEEYADLILPILPWQGEEGPRAGERKPGAGE